MILRALAAIALLLGAPALAAPISTYPAASALTGSEKMIATQGAVTVNVTPAQIATFTGGAVGKGASLGLASGVSTLNLTSYIAAGITSFSTSGYYSAGDAGAAIYYRNSGSAQPGDLVSADGVRLSLSLAQPLTFEMLGAPATGWIGTGSISGTTFTKGATQNGSCCTVGMTLTAAGSGGEVAAGTKITGGSGSTWTVDHSQTATSRVMVANDSYPYVSSALQLGIYGVQSKGSHWFSRTTKVQGYAVKWTGTNGYGGSNAVYNSNWYYPSGYGALVIIPDAWSANAQGDVSIDGNQTFGGANGSVINGISFHIGPHSFPAATVNHRPGIANYLASSMDQWQLEGSDGDGLYEWGNAPQTNADKCRFTNFTISNAYDHGIETGGGDGNTCLFQNFIVSTVGSGAIKDASFLGNSYYNGQLQTTGQVNVIVRRGNDIYYSLQDGNTNHDPLSTVGTWWRLLVHSVGADTWNSGTTYRVGPGIWTTGGGNRSEFYSIYGEGDALPSLYQAVSSGVPLTSIYGGQLANGIDSSSVYNIYGSVAQTVALTAKTGLFNTSVGGGTSYPLTIWNPAGGSLSNAGVGMNFGIAYDAAAPTAPYLWGSIRAFLDGAGSSLFFGTSTGSFSTSSTVELFKITGVGTPSFLPLIDNSYTLGQSSFRFADVKSVLINGSAPVLAGAVTSSPLTMTTARLLGRTTAATGAVEQITVGNGLTMSAGNLAVTPAAAQANSTAPDVATLVADFNSLLAKLRTANLLAP